MQNQSVQYTADLRPPGTSASNPTNVFYSDSFTDILMKSIGYYVTCEFLIGSGGLEVKSGYLYAAGVNFLTLHDDENDQYTICDLYSVKFVTIHSERTQAAQTGGSSSSGNTGGMPSGTVSGSGGYRPQQQTPRRNMSSSR